MKVLMRFSILLALLGVMVPQWGSADLHAATITVELRNGSNALIAASGGSLRYHDGGWKTDAVDNLDGTWTVNTAASSVTYEMTFNNGRQTFSGLSTAITTVTFQTVTTTVALEDSDNNPLNSPASTVRWHQLGWQNWGTANTAMELLPGNYTFEMNYNNGRQTYSNHSVPTGASHTVLFTTVSTTVALEDSDNNPLNSPASTVRWHQLGWQNWGAANTAMELLPGNYTFEMNYNNGRQTYSNHSVPTGASHTVLFSTVTTRISLTEADGTTEITTPVAAARWHQLGWMNWGPANTEMELLPGKYTFEMNFNNGRQTYSNYDIPAGSFHKVIFKTVLTTIAIKDCWNHQIPGGTARWHQLGWENWGAANTSQWLLSGKYTFEATVNNGRQTYSNYDVPDVAAHTVLFTTTKTTINGPGAIQYHQLGWQPFTSPMDLLPGNYTFKLGAQSVGQFAVSGCTWSKSFITVELRDGNGNLITSGASLRYHDGGWKTDAVDNHDGTWSVEADGNTLYYEMTYNNGKQQLGSFPSSLLLITFQTTTTTVRLETHNNAGLSGGVARFHQSSWNAFGTTDGTGNTPTMELLPGKYYFDMVYNGGKQQIGKIDISGTSQTVPFTTVATIVRLETSGNTGLDGGVARYHQSSWAAFGTTGDAATGETNPVELLPGKYYFDMDYNGGKQQIGKIDVIGSTQTVLFTTVGTTVRLETYTHTGLDGGVARYHQSSWTAFGTTGDAATGETNVVELLPGKYYFDMAYNDGKQQIGKIDVTGSTQTVTFTTVETIVRLETHTHAGLAGGDARYHQNSWNAIGTTDGTGNAPPIQLLPGKYYFDMEYHDGKQQIGKIDIAGTVQIVTFTTTATTIRLETSSHAGLDGGVARYHQGSWNPAGTTGDYATGEILLELLPGKYYFDMDYNHGHQQVGKIDIAGATDLVVFTTVTTVVQLKNCWNQGHAGGEARYHQGSWNAFGTTAGNGKTPALELLPGKYYFDMDFNEGRQQIGKIDINGASQTVEFVTTKVTINGPGALQYHQRNWNSFSNPIYLLPGKYYFRIGSTQIGPYQVSGCEFIKSFITVELRDHNGNLITSGGSLEYHDGAWKSDATDNHDGTWTVVSDASSLYYRMTYNHGTQQIGPFPTSQILKTFTTTLVSVNLKDYSGSLITSNDAGSVEYHFGGTWYPLGGTGTNGFVQIELLPTSGYYFKMHYANAYKQIGAMSVTTGPTQDVDFQTTLVSINLKDHSGALITSNDAGNAEYYFGGTWYDLGGTSTNGFVQIELLPTSGYYFAMAHNHARKQVGSMSVGAGPTQDVDFQTTLVSLNLKDHSGSLITANDAGVGEYYWGGTWYSLGGTSTNGYVQIELLPVSGYHFSMTHNNVEREVGAMSVGAGPTQDVDFQTTLVSLNLKDHSGSLITATDAGSGQYHWGGTWYPLGTTGTNGYIQIELLPENGYHFRMSHNDITAQVGSMSVGSGPTQDVDFQTSLVTIHVDEAGPTPLAGATVEHHYGGSWYAFGTTDGSGDASMELLPYSSNYFRASKTGFATGQIGAFNIGSGLTPTYNITLGMPKTATAIENPVPDGFALEQNYPNPFNPTTSISYSVPEDAQVRLVIYDVVGNVVRELVNGMTSAGTYTVQWNSTDRSGLAVPSGTYIYKLSSGNTTIQKSMVLAK